MMGHMLGPEGIYLLAKERQARLLATRRPAASNRLPLRVRIGRGLIAAGAAMGGERQVPTSPSGRIRGRPASPAA